MSKFLKVELVHSGIGYEKRQKDTLRGLGLRRIRQIRILKDEPAIRGMIQKVIHLVRYSEVSSQKLPTPVREATFHLGAKPKPASRKTPAKAAKKIEEKKHGEKKAKTAAKAEAKSHKKASSPGSGHKK